MKRDSFYNALLKNPELHWYEHKDFNSKISLYMETISTWNFNDWHYLFLQHPSLMVSHGKLIMQYREIFTVQGLRHLRQSEMLFLEWCTMSPLTDSQWSQINRRIPKYSSYRLLMF